MNGIEKQILENQVIIMMALEKVSVKNSNNGIASRLFYECDLTRRILNQRSKEDAA